MVLGLVPSEQTHEASTYRLLAVAGVNVSVGNVTTSVGDTTIVLDVVELLPVLELVNAAVLLLTKPVVELILATSPTVPPAHCFFN